MYARIVRRRIKHGAQAAFARAIRSHKLPSPSKAKGIKAYYVIDSAPDEVTVMSVFDTAENLAKWDRVCREVFLDSPVTDHLSSDLRDILLVTGPVKSGIAIGRG